MRQDALNGGSASHIGKKHAVEDGVNGTPKATATRVDDPGQQPKEGPGQALFNGGDGA